MKKLEIRLKEQNMKEKKVRRVNCDKENKTLETYKVTEKLQQINSIQTQSRTKCSLFCNALWKTPL
jgi:murein L,D-transpeptidase YafK